jgi:hypothetical protein
MNKSVYALGRLKSGVMNRTEAAYAQVLEAQKQSGEVLWWEFEGLTFKLAEGSRYTPDFNVMLANGQMEMREVKGRWMDDAKTKIKVAASKFPFLFRAVYSVPKKDGGGFRYEDF